MTYLYVIHILSTNNTAIIGVDQFELYIYYGHHEPFVNITFNDLTFVPKDQLHKWVE